MASSYKVDAMHLLQYTPVHFLGFKADMASLYGRGWELQTERNIERLMTCACLVNRHLRLGAWIPDLDMEASITRPIEVNHVYQVQQVNLAVMAPISFAVWRSREDVELDYRRPPESVRLSEVLELENPTELIVDPNEVQSLLSRIVEIQRPVQKELRDKNRQIVKHTAAKIITLSDYQAA